MISEWRLTAAATSSNSNLNSYEISDDLSRRQIQVLERRYGGRLRAHAAATRIQRAFRQYRLQQQWRSLVVPLQTSDKCHMRYLRNVQLQHCEQLEYGAPHCSERCLQSSCENTRRNRQPYSLISSPHQTSRFTRYHPAVSLSAQLHASRSQERRTPQTHSVEPSTTCFMPQEFCRRMPLELMSPRLLHRRVVADVSQQSSNIWVPRSLLSSRPCHTNSLPRLDYRSQQIASNNVNNRRSQLLSEQQRRRQYRIALNFFNKKPARGIQFLLNWGFINNTPEDVAKLLIGRRGLSKQMIGEYLGNLHDPFSSSVLEHFINEINLKNMEIDVALRHALGFFRLPGEAQKIDRIMQVFSQRYAACNPNYVSKFHGADTVFILSFAIIMLNTDLHSPNIKPSRKMKLEDFIKNLRGIDAGFDIDRNLLVGIYERIRDEEFRSGFDHVTQVMKVDQSIVGKDKPKLVEPHRRLVCYCRLNQISDRTRRQASNVHQREVFLFNDLILIAKTSNKKKTCSHYILRSWSTLLGLRARLFETNYYHYGVSIVYPDGEEILLQAKNDDDRHRFVADVRESVAECTEMEAIRIEVELDKHSGLDRSESQRDSGLPDIDAQNGSSISNGSTSSHQLPQSMHRLSLNSLDSGVIEGTCDLPGS
uniref:SEC7 domain-containing protein n=1 Tax=Syphacia muris TaxID=451379 RepID=A0A0N5AGQ8_9BILA